MSGVTDAAAMAAQIGAAQGLWTHTPVDWGGNLGYSAPMGSAPKDAAKGYLGIGTGTRPGGAVTQAPPAAPSGGVPVITNITPAGNIGTTTADILFIINPAPTSCRVNYGTDPTTLSLNAAGTATAGSQVVTLTGLTSLTQYWVQVQATNAVGTALTTPLTFKTH